MRVTVEEPEVPAGSDIACRHRGTLYLKIAKQWYYVDETGRLESCSTVIEDSEIMYGTNSVPIGTKIIFTLDR